MMRFKHNERWDKMRNILITILVSILSPTFVRASNLKNRYLKDSIIKRAYIIKKLNTQYFIMSLFFAMILFLYNKILILNSYIGNIILFIILYLSFSRVNEIFLAFLKDAKDKMEYKPQSGKGLKYIERLILALKSYVELMINYGMIYYILNTNAFRNIYFNGEKIFNYDFKNLIESIYFSASTITTLGYGDFTPTHAITQLLSIFEVITGMLLIVVSFTIYVSLNFASEGNLTETTLKNSYKDKVIYNEKISLITIILFILFNVYKLNNYIGFK